MSSGSLVSKIVSDASAVETKVKNAIVKAMQEVDGVVLPDAAKYEPIVAQVAAAIVPQGAAVVTVAYAWLEACAKVLDAGGAAAEANFASAGVDTAAIASVKGLIPALKAASNAGTGTAAPAPAPTPAS